jgi:hypothetical protein
MPISDDCVDTPMSYSMATQHVSIGGYNLPAQKVVAARELTGGFAAPGLAMR